MEKEDYRHSLKSSYLQTMITNFDLYGFKFCLLEFIS
jgi:hypothetical protein